MTINQTHDPSLRSWVESAQDPSTDFPIQNLPIGCFKQSHNGHAHAHLGVPIGDQLLDVTGLIESGHFDDEDPDFVDALDAPALTGLLSHAEFTTRLRRRLQKFLSADAPAGQQARRLRSKHLLPLSEQEYLPAFVPRDFTDFYASKHHAANVGAMFRPDNPLLPNYRHVPIGYHGRASTIVISGTPVRRPLGQLSPPDGEPAAQPRFAPSAMLDYEMELGLIIGEPTEHGDPVAIADAARHMFGLCIVNDWSARDIQKWEYQPLGPFLAKNFATSISPFIVTMEALEPFRIPGPERTADDPAPLAYLRTDDPWGFNITVEVAIRSAQMRERGLAPHHLSRGTFASMYWTFAQLLTHHASNGCRLLPGDLLGSGTISGPTPDSRGCLLELTWRGHDPVTGKPRPREPITLPTGEARTFIHDGDEVIMRAFAQRDGFRRIGFGECRGTITPAPAVQAV